MLLMKPRRWFTRVLAVGHRDEFLFVILGVVVFVGMALKAHFSGVVYDEAFTFDSYSASLFRAWAVYNEPNNHVLNSWLVHYAREIFPGYEHGLRLPALVSAAAALLCWGGIVQSSVLDRGVRIAAFAFLPLNYYFFDLMYLARGYTFALSAMLLFILLLVWYVRGAARLTSLLVVLPLCNIVALGSILTHALVMVPVNLVFLWSVWCRRLVHFQPFGAARAGRLAVADTLVAGAIVAALSGIGLLAIYAKVLEKVAGLLEETSRVGFWRLLGEASANWFSATWIEAVLLAFLFGCLCVRALWRHHRDGFDWRAIDARRVVVYTAVGTVLLAGFYIGGLDRRIGYTRNLSFFLPLMILIGAILVDDALRELERAGRAVLATALVLTLSPVLVRNIPSLYAIEIEGWKQQTCSAAIAKKLEGIDSVRTWNIHFSENSRFVAAPMDYYGRHGYRVQTIETAPADLKVFHRNELDHPEIDRRRIWLFDYFKNFDCVVMKMREF